MFNMCETRKVIYFHFMFIFASDNFFLILL